MGATRYQKIMRVLTLLKSTHGDLVPNQILRVEILKFIGSDKRAIDGAIRLMNELNLIEEDGTNTRLK